MQIKKNDFIEIEFTAKTSNGEIFDTNKKQDLDKENIEIEPKPLIFPIGNEFFLKGVEDYLIGKKIPSENKIELTSENAFGKRDPKLIRLIPLRVFNEQKTKPAPGMIFNFDGRIGKVISTSGGRVTVDFNNPLAGKEVIYEVTVLGKIEDINEKIKSLMNFFYRKEFPFEVKEKKLIVKAEKAYKEFAELLKGKFKEILDLDIIFEEQEAKEDKKINEEKNSTQNIDKEKENNNLKKDEKENESQENTKDN